MLEDVVPWRSYHHLALARPSAVVALRFGKLAIVAVQKRCSYHLWLCCGFCTRFLMFWFLFPRVRRTRAGKSGDKYLTCQSVISCPWWCKRSNSTYSACLEMGLCFDHLLRCLSRLNHESVGHLFLSVFVVFKRLLSSPDSSPRNGVASGDGLVDGGEYGVARGDTD